MGKAMQVFLGVMILFFALTECGIATFLLCLIVFAVCFGGKR